MIPAAFSLAGRTALITGAGAPDGIGFATAKLLVELGASVHLAGRSDRVRDRTAELGGVAHVADLTSEGDVHTMLGQLTSLDILVNNAGMTSVSNPIERSGESGSVSQLSYSGWTASLQRNLDSAFLVTKAALPLLRESTNARIIMVSSVTGPAMAMANDAAYAASKAGMVGLTRALALDEAKFGLTCNAVAPGWIATGSQTTHEAEQGERTPLRRSATPEEVAATIAWLATPGASYVTGQCIVVDGGNSIAEERA